MKMCTKCKEEKQLAEFHKDKAKHDGHGYRCKDCVQAADLEYRQANKDRIAFNNREWRSANAEKRAAYKRAYRAANWDVLADYQREYQQANPEVSWANRYRARASAFGFTPVVESFDRADVVALYGDACFHCGKNDFAHLDHWPTAVALGGHHKLFNVRPSCAKCNIAQAAPVRSARQANRNTTEILALVVKGLTEQGSPVG